MAGRRLLDNFIQFGPPAGFATASSEPGPRAAEPATTESPYRSYRGLGKPGDAKDTEEAKGRAADVAPLPGADGDDGDDKPHAEGMLTKQQSAAPPEEATAATSFYGSKVRSLFYAGGGGGSGTHNQSAAADEAPSPLSNVAPLPGDDGEDKLPAEGMLAKQQSAAPPEEATAATSFNGSKASQVTRDKATDIYNKRIDYLVNEGALEDFFDKAGDPTYKDNLMDLIFGVYSKEAVGVKAATMIASRAVEYALPSATSKVAAGVAVAAATAYGVKKTNDTLLAMVDCKDLTSDEVVQGTYSLTKLWRFQKGAGRVLEGQTQSVLRLLESELSTPLNRSHNTLLLALERLARLCALSYEDNCFMERVAFRSQGLSVIYSKDGHTDLAIPKFAVFARVRPEKVAYFVIRGTHDKDDIMTDLNAAIVDLKFLDESGTLAGHFGLEGIAKVAANMHEFVRPILERLQEMGFKVTMTGHSLGGAVAGLLAALWRAGGTSLASIDCVCFAAPPCMDQRLSKKLYDARKFSNILSDAGSAKPALLATAPQEKGTVLTIVNNNDIVPRLSRQNFKHLFKVILAGKPSWATSLSALRDDVAVDAWAKQADPAEKLASFLTKEALWMEKIREAEEAAASASAKSAQIDLEVPGRVFYLYKVRGKSFGAELVPRKDSGKLWPPSLVQIQPTPGMFDDHGIKSYAEELHTIMNSWDSTTAPIFHPFGGTAEHPISKCEVCDRDFSLGLKLKSTNFIMAMHHCRSCGSVVCDTCSKHKRALPQFGMRAAQRICDICVFGPSKP